MNEFTITKSSMELASLKTGINDNDLSLIALHSLLIHVPSSVYTICFLILLLRMNEFLINKYVPLFLYVISCTELVID